MQLQRLLTTEKFVLYGYFQCETNLPARFAFLRFSCTLEIQDSSPDFGVLMLAHNLGKKTHFVLEISVHDKISSPLKMFLPKCKLNRNLHPPCFIRSLRLCADVTLGSAAFVDWKDKVLQNLVFRQKKFFLLAFSAVIL